MKRIFALFAVLVILMASVFAQADEDDLYLGVELDKLITLGSSVLATLLFVLTAIAYKRDKRKRLFFVSIAFFIFAVKGFLISSELFVPEMDWVDPATSFLDFAILITFFIGLLKK